MAELDMDIITEKNIALTMFGETRLTIGEHSFPISFGAILLSVLNTVILPNIGPSFDNLHDFFAANIDCEEVGITLAAEIDFGSPALFEGACLLGLEAAAGSIENMILDMDQNALELVLEQGTTYPKDTNTDRIVDLLQNGTWSGQIIYEDEPTIMESANFHGTRNQITQ